MPKADILHAAKIPYSARSKIPYSISWSASDIKDAGRQLARLLPMRCERPSGRAADKREEITSPHNQPQGSERGIVAGQTGRLEVVKTALAMSALGQADTGASKRNVRFNPKSGHGSIA